MRLARVLLSCSCLVAAVAAAAQETATPSPASTREAILRRHAATRGVHATDTHAEHAPGAGVWAELLAGNRRFVAGKPRSKPLVQSRQDTKAEQHPSAVVLACSDSRVSPEHVFDRGLGEIFVVRTAGNVADAVAVGSMEYAVLHLHTKLLVVMGHEKCGAVTAAAAGGSMPSPNLEAIVRNIEPALEELRGELRGDELVRRGVEENVHHAARSLLDHSPILRAAVDRGELTIVKGVYALDTGEVRVLP